MLMLILLMLMMLMQMMLMMLFAMIIQENQVALQLGSEGARVYITGKENIVVL